MNDEDLDRVLAGTEEIVPSSGFAASVMEAVRQEAATPAPIPFPWKWALPGLIACVALVVVLAIRLAHSSLRAGYNAAAALPMFNLSSMLPQGMEGTSVRLGIEWSVLALLVSVAAVWFSMRIVNGRSR